MKKLLLILAGFLAMGNVYALSCAGPPATFEEMLADSAIAFVGTVTSVDVALNSSEQDYCDQFGTDVQPGTYTFNFDVEDAVIGTVGSTISLDRQVSGANCTWGGACNDMIVGETYVVLTEDGENLPGGLCSLCPYKEYSLAIDHLYSNGYLDEGDDVVEVPQICACAMIYAPVCGVDGQTYSNECVAGCDSIDIAYIGECTFGNPGECQRGYSGKVCGANGMTYDDICDMEDAGVTRAYDGECVDNPNPLGIVDAPNFCTSWYDGCNECGINNSILGPCTQRACFTMNRAKCTAFDFKLLKTHHEDLIEEVVYKWLETASSSDKELVIAKVTAKIADINHTLSVSSFAIGSEVLWKHEFVYEVLWKIDSLM